MNPVNHLRFGAVVPTRCAGSGTRWAVLLVPATASWVLRDLTGRNRWTRQVVRAAVQVVPLAVVLLLTLGTVWITWIGVICGLVLALICSVVYLDQSADYRPW